MDQDRGESARKCPRCGAAVADGVCAGCGDRRGRTGLWLLAGGLAGDDGSREHTPPRPVRLVREWKGPTVRDLLAAQDATVEPLPGRIHAVAERVGAGDLPGAERRLDAAMAALLPGPGREERARSHRRAVLLAFACVVLALCWLLCAVLYWSH